MKTRLDSLLNLRQRLSKKTVLLKGTRYFLQMVTFRKHNHFRKNTGQISQIKGSTHSSRFSALPNKQPSQAL